MRVKLCIYLDWSRIQIEKKILDHCGIATKDGDSRKTCIEEQAFVIVVDILALSLEYCLTMIHKVNPQ